MATGHVARHRRDGQSSAKALLNYIQDHLKTGENSWLMNALDSDTTADEHAAAIESLTMLAPRSKNPLYHGIISWPADERPTPAQAHEAGLMLLQEHGFDTSPSGHLGAIALHQDTDCWHIHVMASRIHPVTEKPLKLEWSARTATRATRKIELAQGWRHTDGGLAEVAVDADGQPHIIEHARATRRADGGASPTARRMEYQTGKTSFSSYIKSAVAPAFQLAVKGGDWQQVHQTLARHHAQIVPHGSGYRIRDLDDAKAYCAASAAGSFAKGSRLESKLGEYQPPSADSPIQPDTRYAPEAPDGTLDLAANRREARRMERDAAARQRAPNRQRYTDEGAAENRERIAQRRTDREELYQHFSVIRDQRRDEIREHKSRKSELTKRHQRERRDLHSQLKRESDREWSHWRRQPKSDRLPYSVQRGIHAIYRRNAMDDLKSRQQQEKAAISPTPSAIHWRPWLREQSGYGDHRAARVLRGIEYRESGRSGGIQPATLADQRAQTTDPEQIQQRGQDAATRAVLNRRSDPIAEGRTRSAVESIHVHPSSDGRHAVYHDDERGLDVGLDRGDRIDALATDRESVDQLVKIAGERYGGSIELYGDEQFKRDAAEAAGRAGIRITNDDEDLREIWQAARDEATGQTPAPAPAPIEQPDDDLPDLIEDDPSLDWLPDNWSDGSDDEQPATLDTQEDTKMAYIDRSEIDRIKRSADLEQIATRYGYERTEGTDSSRNLKMKKAGGGESIAIQRRSDGDVYFSTSGDRQQSGDAIKFVQNHESGMNFQQAAAETRRQAGLAPVQPIQRQQQARAERSAWTAQRLAYVHRNSGGGPDHYLESRGLTEDSTGPDMRVSSYREHAGNVQAWHRDAQGKLTGFENRGFHPNGEKFSHFQGDRREGLYSTGNSEDPRHILVTESAIDAESARELYQRQDTLYASTGGNPTDEQLDHIAQLAQRHDANVVAGMDADAAGDEHTQKIAERMAQDGREVHDARERGLQGYADWNERLTAEIEQGEHRHPAEREDAQQRPRRGGGMRR